MYFPQEHISRYQTILGIKVGTFLLEDLPQAHLLRYFSSFPKVYIVRSEYVKNIYCPQTPKQ